MPKFPSRVEDRDFSECFCESDSCDWNLDLPPTAAAARAHSHATGHTVCFQRTRQKVYSPVDPPE